jgi:hypothetical protein
VIAAVGFLGDQALRARRLASGAIVAAIGFTAELAYGAISTAIDATHHADGKTIASDALQAAGAIGFIAGALLVAVAFARYAAQPARRDGLLGGAALVLSPAYALLTVASILTVILYSDLGITGALPSGLDVAASGQGVAIFAAIVGAVAFFIRSKQRPGPNRIASNRDRLLATATSAFTVAFLLTAIGTMISAGALSTPGVSGEIIAASWLAGVQYLGFTIAAISASVALALSGVGMPESA